ncbi:TrfA family protein [bacterium]|nr:TrfA family protein [bacterium]
MGRPDDLSRDLADCLEGLRKTLAAATTHDDEGEAAPPAGSRVVQLPLWPESRRASPNAIFRSALFPALNFKEGRPVLKGRVLASVAGIKVLFTGERFDQSDLDVYLELLHHARFHPLGTECAFSVYGMLKALGRHTGNHDHKWLHGVLIRLCGGVVDITDQRKRYFGTLIHGGFTDELARHYRIRINTEFAGLFGFGMWASIDRAQRRALGRNATAKFLHAYYSTHAKPGPHRFETLAAIVGLNNSNRRQQRATLLTRIIHGY